MARTSDKRERLVAAGCEVLYEQGLRGTSLADIAERAGVPIGNVYYYFKTKEELARAVIAQRRLDIEARYADIEATISNPHERLREFVRRASQARTRVATHGCPYGTLAQELRKSEGVLADEAGDLLRIQTNWVASQYQALGVRRGQAKAQAVELVASMQGASLLTHALCDPTIMKREFERLDRALVTQAPL
ncbi:Transcriptional regulator, TetR family protein [Enhygromyxa salina]|uniref:Transcriptional regulator, TetR family protein n=1 Tax=Enhygromyxa salina TaxID=215803 RepID=A0A0C1ZPZ4_9BACT|nr:TetR/AcrR family transcriptional regulator [Enhygromyxa salina]KIG19659.1 Transcriptional regulator, TetR family protein [Enhygromyxa salina]